MARVLYTSWFSPFARKVALALELKGLPYEAVDGLARDSRSALQALNARVEVPVLVDDDVVVVNSSDIVQYLEWRYPETSLYPQKIPERVTARALERLADNRLDPIVVDCSYWLWAERDDQPPSGLIEAGRKDWNATLLKLESALAKRPKPWPFGSPGVVECAWYANLLSGRAMGFAVDANLYPTVNGWLSELRTQPVFANDRRRTAAFLKTLSSSTHERNKLFWSGERLEWLFARGFHDWFAAEIAAGRVHYPD